MAISFHVSLFLERSTDERELPLKNITNISLHTVNNGSQDEPVNDNLDATHSSTTRRESTGQGTFELDDSLVFILMIFI